MAVTRIHTSDDVDAGLAALVRQDPRLETVAAVAGPVPLRLRPPGFAGLAEIVVSQQVSKASAAAIWGRLIAAVDPLTAQTVAASSDTVLADVGLSRPKQKTLRMVARAILDDDFDLDGACGGTSDAAIAALTELHGIGRWTAEVYLLFCHGHRDLFPARDVALQAAVGHAFGCPERPREKDLIEIAERWSPWRGVAARLFWAYYRQMRDGRDAMPV